MRVFVAWVQENDWESAPYNIGVYSTREKAENALVEKLREAGEPVLSLEIYESLDNQCYLFEIEEYILDELRESR